MAKRGLYANIHAKRKRIKAGSGETMRKPGSKGAPSAADFRKSAKTAKKKPALKKLGMRDVKFFRIANRKGYAAIAKNNLTEGRTVYQAYSRLVKACKRNGYELPEKGAGDMPKVR